MTRYSFASEILGAIALGGLILIMLGTYAPHHLECFRVAAATYCVPQ